MTTSNLPKHACEALVILFVQKRIEKYINIA